jgi:hypothetical protein
LKLPRPALQWESFVHFALGVKPRNGCTIECSNGSEMGTRNVILFCEGQQSRKAFIAFAEDH